MLQFLQIRDYAIVESLELEFDAGFSCITGETGAGKSILIGALGLLSGRRADSSAVRQGATRSELTAGFEVQAGSAALAWLTENDMEDGRDCLLRRVIHANGRSRAWVNGSAVTLQQLAELGEFLVEIHGQNEHLRLTRSEEQFRLLDGQAGYEVELAAVREAYFAWHELEMEKRALLEQSPLDAAERELLEYQVDELSSTMIPAAEFGELENEHRKLAHGGEIVTALESALAVLQAEPAAVGGHLYRIAKDLEEHATLDRDIAAAAALLSEAAINCDESAAALQSALSRMDLSPERLADLEGRLGTQHDLARKHRVEPDRLESVLARLGERLEQSAAQEKRLSRIDADLESALSAYRAAACCLGEKRAARAAEVGAGVTALMQSLGMEGGRFRVDLARDETAAPSPRGDDRIGLSVSANPGVEPGPLRKVASGGELSRISLAVKIVTRQQHAETTQLFDEVDAGIGGETATAVGSLLKTLASAGQALCVTHLAQVAAFADRQVLVSKQSGAGATSVTAKPLTEKQRIEEVARMLGGQLSEQSRAHAAELLKEAAAARH